MENGTGVFYEMDELVYGGPLFGESNFVTVDELQYREFLKGGSIIFLFNLKGKLNILMTYCNNFFFSSTKPANIPYINKA